MKIKAIKGHQGIGTDVKDTTYVEAERWGKYRGWRYVLGLVIILFAWLVIGSLASVGVVFALSGQPDHSVLGPVGKFLFVMVGFPFFLSGVLIAVTLIHRCHPLTLITAREKINWQRVGHGFVAGFVPFCLIGGLGQYLFYPNIFSFNSDLAAFAFFVPIALVFTAIQTTTEELFFRGYIVQGASVVWSNRVFLAIVPAVIFTLPHLLNPEAIAGGWLTVFFTYFLVPGLVLWINKRRPGTTRFLILSCWNNSSDNRYTPQHISSMNQSTHSEMNVALTGRRSNSCVAIEILRLVFNRSISPKFNNTVGKATSYEVCH
jgi:uncharacterized protein